MRQTATVVVTLIITSSIAIGQVVLFEDDFTGGMDEAWMTPEGGWIAEDGHLSVTTSCGFQQCNPNLYAGGPNQYSYIVSFDFMITEAFTYHGAGVGCYVALSNPIEPAEGPTSGYSIGCGWSSDGSPENANCEIWRMDNSAGTQLGYDTGSQFWNASYITYHMKLGRVGSNLVMKKWQVGTPEPDWLMSITDDTYSSGYWLLIFWNNIGWIDNFRVEGYGVVPSDESSWGGVKALYR